MRRRPRSRSRRAILVALTRADLRARYGRGPGQVVKWILDPLALLGVFVVLTAVVLDRPGPAPALSVACAVVPFQLLMLTVMNAMSSVGARRSIILNMRFDRALIPAAAAGTELIAFGGYAVILAGTMVIEAVAPTAAIAWLPLIVAVNALLALGLAYAAAVFGVWFPLARTFGASAVRMMFFIAPSLVPLADVPAAAQDWLKINPFSGIFEGYRDALLYGQAPAAWELLVPAGWAGLLLLVAVPIFRSEQRHFAKAIA